MGPQQQHEQETKKQKQRQHIIQDSSKNHAVDKTIGSWHLAQIGAAGEAVF